MSAARRDGLPQGHPEQVRTRLLVGQVSLYATFPTDGDTQDQAQAMHVEAEMKIPLPGTLAADSPERDEYVRHTRLRLAAAALQDDALCIETQYHLKDLLS